MADYDPDGIPLPESYAAPTIDVNQREATHVGSRYEGSVSIATGRREGKGKYIYPNSFFTYEGEWLDGKKHGRGRLNLGNDGDYYEGDFNQGEIVGQGTQRWRNGTVYNGAFKNGERHGEGTIQWANRSSYNGAWAHNKYSGEGTLSFPNGDGYVGQFKSHKYHGSGVLTQPGADRRYEGSFEAGLFEGKGSLRARGGAFVYEGEFKANKMCGRGRGHDTSCGIAYDGTWAEDKPTGCSAGWDVAAPSSHEKAGESFLVMAETIREEAAEQANPALADPKAKAKAKGKAAPKKGEAPPEEEPAPEGPLLELTLGQPLPEVVLRLVDGEKNAFPGESGRRWKVTMYRERMVPKEDDPAEMETIRREVRFADARVNYVDPLDAQEAAADPKAKAKAKAAASPEPPPEPAEDEPAEKPYEGEASVDGAVGEDGTIVIGNSDVWKLPAHLQPLIYWLRVEDTTEGIDDSSFCQLLPPLEFPVRVVAPPSE